MMWPASLDPRQGSVFRQLEPPVTRALLVFATTIGALTTVVVAGVSGLVELPISASSNFGVMAATTFTIAGGLATHRAVTTRNPWVGATAAVLFGPGAVWSVAAFVTTDPPPRPVTVVVAIMAIAVAIALLMDGLRATRWLEVFGGVGSLGLGLVAVLAAQDPAVATSSAIPALLASVAGMTCVYGLLVDLEVAEHRSLVELQESRQQIEDEVDRVEELLHDLRSGLLAIEAAIGSFDDELVAPLQSEAARLRRLTLTGDRTTGPFDLAASLASMVASRRRCGGEIVLRSPERAMAWGEESEVLSIVDNLLSNAERHGRDGSIEIDLAVADGSTRLTVANPGALPDDDPEVVFRRGVTTHPDGRGLGLARARMLAGINGGDLRVGPAPAGWTSFVLTLRTEPTSAVA